jgi:plasmid stability protein
MPVNLSIKHVPDKIVAKLKRRAAANHRSLQGELVTILEQAAETPGTAGETKKSVDEVWRELKRIGLRTPDESVQMIREDRDAR